MDITTKRQAINDDLKRLVDLGQQMEREYQNVKDRVQQLLGKLEALAEFEKESTTEIPQKTESS